MWFCVCGLKLTATVPFLNMREKKCKVRKKTFFLLKQRHSEGVSKSAEGLGFLFCSGDSDYFIVRPFKMQH